MRLSSILRIASAVVLLCSMSSFSGCEKDNVGPRGGNCTKKPTTTTPTTTPITTPTTTPTTTTTGTN